MDELYITCIVPLYNESLRFARGIEGIHSYLESAGRSYELLIVNDGSTDDTAALAERFAKDKPAVRVLGYSPNRGKGFAIRTGVKEARGRIVFFTDIDLSVPIDALENFLALLEAGEKVVVGTRTISKSMVAVHQSWHREAMGVVFRRMSSCFFVPYVTDFTCGFKALRKEAAKEIFKRCTVDGWSFDTEALYIAHLLGYRIHEVPVVWRDDKRTKVRLGKAVASSIRDLIRIKSNERRGLYR